MAVIRTKFALFASIVACVLTGCGGSTPSATCPTLLPGSGAAPIPAQLLYPEPGATGVPDGNFTMVTATATSLTLTGGSNVVALPSPGAAPSPLPSPMATPLVNGNLLQGEAVPALQPHTTYTVKDQRGTAGVCNPPANLGYFTTQ